MSVIVAILETKYWKAFNQNVLRVASCMCFSIILPDGIRKVGFGFLGWSCPCMITSNFKCCENMCFPQLIEFSKNSPLDFNGA